MPKPIIPRKLPEIVIDWETLVPAIGQASRAIALYEGILSHLPNPYLLISPIITQEAVLSSRIEGTRVTFTEVLQFEAGEAFEQESQQQDAIEVINYRKAIWQGVNELQRRPFNLNLLKDMHKTLLDSARGYNKLPGSFRREQNFIGPPGSTLETADFVPPDWMLLSEYLDDWEKFYHTDIKDPLVQLALIHAQFKFLHPFLDGNGRLGRILVPFFLYEKKLLTVPGFYLSEYFEKDRNGYYGHLRALGNDDHSWNQWCAYFLNAVTKQAEQNTHKVRSMLVLYDRLKIQVIKITHSQFALPMLDLMFSTPIFQSNMFEGKEGMPGRAMTLRILAKLKDEGVLATLREGRGRRTYIYALTDLISLTEGSEPN